MQGIGTPKRTCGILYDVVIVKMKHNFYKRQTDCYSDHISIGCPLLRMPNARARASCGQWRNITSGNSKQSSRDGSIQGIPLR